VEGDERLDDDEPVRLEPGLPPEMASPLAPFNGQKPPAPAWFVDALAKAPERRLVRVLDANIEVLTWGQVGKPGLIFVHGNSAHADWWSFIAPFLMDAYRVASVSLSGMGGSDWRETYTFEGFATEIHEAARFGGLYEAPVKPIFIPFSWGWWFAVSLPLLVSLVSWLSRKLPGIAPGWIALATAFPLFLAYQLYVEGSSVANGWWTYDVVIGPALESVRGRLPVVFPALLGLWVAWFVARLARHDEDGFWPHEHRWGVATKPAGWRRELARAWAMIVLFQVSFFIINIAPAILGRALFGGPSALVP